jgi:hypothetical protein
MPFFAPLITEPALSGWWAALPQGSPVFGGGGPDFIFPRLSVDDDVDTHVGAEASSSESSDDDFEDTGDA